MSISDRLDEIQARADKATDGPWITGGSIEEGVTRFGTLNDPDDPSEPGVLLGDVAYEANAEFIAHARTDVPALVAGYRKILDLHKPVEVEPSDTICRECSYQLSNGRYFGKVEEWPCPTVRAIASALGEE